ncbi:MAG TPA: class I SAM-dependent methyltransferase [Candidatus Saccharimonadales bacterium]|nr:class I SAM-dependent methyltransferase [Candidatus Saccharimonadales bacterium]
MTPPIAGIVAYAAASMRRVVRPSSIPPWPVPFDSAAELDWGRPEYAPRLLREHLDQSHDGASRRRSVIAGQVRRLRRLLPAPPARILDGGCGPGLYAVPLAALGYEVTGVDVSAPALRHARRLAREADLSGKARFVKGDLRDVPLAAGGFDAALLVYFVLEAFSRTEQASVLARIATSLAPHGILIVEMRLRPDQPPGRIDWWDVVPDSLLSDRRHVLLGDAVYDQRRHTYVLREVAIFDDGSVSVRQTSGWLCPFASIPRLFAGAGLADVTMFDGWTGSPAHALSETVLVVARRAQR